MCSPHFSVLVANTMRFGYEEPRFRCEVTVVGNPVNELKDYKLGMLIDFKFDISAGYETQLLQVGCVPYVFQYSECTP